MSSTTTPKPEPIEDTDMVWQAPAFLRLPWQAACWAVVNGWQHRGLLSPIYGASVLQAVAAVHGLPWWVLTISTIALAAVAYLIGRIKEIRLPWQAFNVSCALASGSWLTAAAVAGQVNPWVISTWVAGTAAATCGREHLVKRGAPELPAPKPVLAIMPAPPHPLQATIDDVTARLTALRDKIGIPELAILSQEIVTDSRFTLTIRSRRSTRLIDSDRENTTAILGLPVGMLRRITAIAEDAGVQTWHFQVGEPHGGKSVNWVPPLWEGDILEPVAIGVREDEEEATMLLAHPEIGVYHGATSGKTGYGKTVHQQGLGAAIANCRNAVPLVGDLKPALDFAPLAPVVPWYGTTPEEVTWMLMALASLCEPGASSRGPLKRRTDRVLVPDEDAVALILILDEMRMVFSREMNPRYYKEANTAALTIALLGRALGVGIHVAGQNMSEPAMPQTGERSGTEFRAQMHHRRVFHEDSSASGQFLLDDYARLDVSTLKRPGRFYHAAGDAPSMPILGYDIPDREKLHQWALRRARSQQGIDERTQRLLGEAFASRRQRVPAEIAEWLPPATPATVRPPASAGTSVVPPSQEVRAFEDQLGGEPAPLLNAELESLAKGLERYRNGVTRSQLEQATGKGRSWVGARLRALAALDDESVIYSTGQGRGVRWHLADGVDGERLRMAITAVDAALRMIKVGEGLIAEGDPT
ncbi:hypothetical protein [Planobispora rosea]|uniref:hypothetical protein n=1 Tax=Planobispora rosea TaxID=35762 RepID=UPI000839FC33|nr:hypothetical protein [Planobispora rosea]